jgi:ketosteroid isomerase-like protein
MFGFLFVSIISGCNNTCTNKINTKAVQKEIVETEKAFEKAAKEKGIAEAFYQFADKDAVILRRNDSLIIGNENIRNYYQQTTKPNAEVSWSPDFVAISADGTLGYTYGKYLWKITADDGKINEYRGVFHTVWKRQQDGSWKYVWD